MNKKESKGLGILILGIIVIIFVGIAELLETVGIVIPVIILVGCIGFYFYHKNRKSEQKALLHDYYEKERHETLISKYKDEEVVNNIINEIVWQGETNEQLIDSLGKPKAIDNKLLKTKKKEIYKYYHQGANRYKLRITLENDVVVGWDNKA